MKVTNGMLHDTWKDIARQVQKGLTPLRDYVVMSLEDGSRPSGTVIGVDPEIPASGFWAWLNRVRSEGSLFLTLRNDLGRDLVIPRPYDAEEDDFGNDPDAPVEEVP